MRDPHTIIIKPHITEKSVALSYGDPSAQDESQIQRRYTFLVDRTANKIEIKNAIESIYNAGKKSKDDMIDVETVRTINVRGKTKKQGWQAVGKKADVKKAIITLARGQMLEDYGV